MSGVYFHIDLWAFLVVLAAAMPAYLLYRWKEKFVEPSMSFPDLSSFMTGDKLKKSARLLVIKLPSKCLFVALGLFTLAFIDPRLNIEKNTIQSGLPPKISPKEGIAIYLVLDQSGSMQEKVFSEVSTGNFDNQLRPVTKIDLVKQVTKEFIEGDESKGLGGRLNDMIGLIYFARGARIVSPLTLDHATILSDLAKFDAIKDRDQDGTSIGYAIFKAANLIAATRDSSLVPLSKDELPYNIKSYVIILLTDGLQDPNPLDKGKRLKNIDIPEAAAYVKDQGIKLYIINVEPKLSDEKYAPNRNIMQRAALSTGGKFYMVDDHSNLSQIYQEIDKLEKSLIRPQSKSFSDDKERYNQIVFYPYLLGLGMLLMLVSQLLDTRFLRKIP